MSEENKLEPTADPELDDLLDSALEDFSKLPKPSSKKEEIKCDSTSKVTEVSEEDELADATWSEDFIKQTASQFEKNLQTLMKNGGDSDVNDSLQKMAQTVSSAISSGSGGDSDGDGADFQAAIAQALKGISATSENLQNSGAGMTEDELASMFGQATLDEGPEGLFPFMQGMMQSLFSKEVLYPSLKELSDKYPAWLESQKDSLPATELEQYTKQLDLMQKVCKELEIEKAEDSEDIKKQRFETILALMQEMQTCGQPPADLLGDQAVPGFDSGEAPTLPIDPQNCSIM